MPLCPMSLKSREIDSHIFLFPPTWSPSTHFCNFVCQDSEVLPLSSLESLSLSSCFLVPAPLPCWDFLACNLLLTVVLHIRSASLTSDKGHQLSLGFLQFPHCQQVLPLCSLLLPLLLTGAPRSWHVSWTKRENWRAVSAFWHPSAPQQLHTLPPRLGCGGKIIYPRVRTKDFRVKYQTLESKRVTQICRQKKMHV